MLIFCQLKQMLDLIEKDLFKPHMPTVTYMRMDGTTDPSKRHGVVQTFNADPSIDCLLLTTHVGGLGLNLTGADTVIFIEHDWNPMKDLQAMDRAHRIGQTKQVYVFRFVTEVRPTWLPHCAAADSPSSRTPLRRRCSSALHRSSVSTSLSFSRDVRSRTARVSPTRVCSPLTERSDEQG